ncbi:MAG: UDP-N-acetylmuramoyl-tripeptide--D-alanyl-D-alanine ligase [Bacteroidales bacterium]|nr:UDP-N-acetylmuramoyl-tripeptide--D-alanyl-D-alanine ligase [Bacteroidales bacterium]
MDSTLQQIYSLFKISRSVCTDSRKIRPGDIFFALKGDHFDGNTYAIQAIEHGAVCAVVDDVNLPESDKLIRVDDVLKTLQQIASHHRSIMKATVIGITGSNGKTTTKELLAAVLSTKFKTICTQGNLNNHIGVPLTLLTIDENTEIAVIEMGANHQGEIRSLCLIAQPEIGLITNIGKAHLEGFGGFTGVINAKSELYAYIDDHGGKVFVNIDNQLLNTLSVNMIRQTYGSLINSDLYAEVISVDPFVHLRWEYQNIHSVVQTRLIGEYNAENIMAAIAIGSYFGIEKSKINEAVSTYNPTNLRSQLVQTERNRVIVDAYNANPVSMEAAIRNFFKFMDRKAWIIIGDMLELGKESDYEHAGILKLLTDLDAEMVILVGKNFGEVYGGDDWLHFNDVEALNQHLKKHPISGCDVLLKASRGIGLEKALPFL